MAVVRFMPKPWQMNDFASVKEHIKQFYEKFEELGMIHVPKTTDPNFETLADTRPTTSVNNGNWEYFDICEKYFQFPKGDGTINYSEPDEHGIYRIESFSPHNVDLYIKIRFFFRKISYNRPNTGSRGFCLDTEIIIDRLGEFMPNVTYPTWNSFTYYDMSGWGAGSGYQGIVNIIGESVLSLTPDGLIVLHGLHTTNASRNMMCGGPRNLMQFVVNIHSDGTVGIYNNSVQLNCAGSDYSGDLVTNNNYKCCYNFISYKTNHRTDYYTRPVSVTPYPFTDVPNNAQGFIQGLPCYYLDHQSNIIESHQVYTFLRGLVSGDNPFIVWRNGKPLHRTLYIQDQNGMTPSYAGGFTATWATYNREYGHIIEEAPLI